MSNKSSNFELSGQDALKAIFRLHASGVAVITLADEDENPMGFTATSVTSLGSNPPLASFNVASGSSTYPLLKPGRLVAIHSLGAENLDLAQRMAGPKENRFSTEDWDIAEGVPVFDCASAVLIAKIRQVISVELNAVVVVDVLQGTLLKDSESPLVYYRRGYQTLGKRLAENS